MRSIAHVTVAIALAAGCSALPEADTLAVAHAGAAPGLCARWTISPVAWPGVDASLGLRAHGGDTLLAGVLARGRDGDATLLGVDAASASVRERVPLPAAQFGAASDALATRDGWVVAGGRSDAVSVFRLAPGGASRATSLVVDASAVTGAADARLTERADGAVLVAWRGAARRVMVRSLDGAVQTSSGTVRDAGEWGPDAYYAVMESGSLLCGILPHGGYNIDTRMPTTSADAPTVVPAVEGARAALVAGLDGAPSVIFAKPGRMGVRAGSAGYTVDAPMVEGAEVRGAARAGGSVFVVWRSPPDADGIASLRATEVTRDGVRGEILTLATVRSTTAAVTVARVGDRMLALTADGDGVAGAVATCAP